MSNILIKLILDYQGDFFKILFKELIIILSVGTNAVP